MWKYHCNIDWLQTYCLGNVLSDGMYSDGNMRFQVVSKHEETKLFKYVFNVYHGGQKVATVTQGPKTPVINPRASLVKLENRVLYCEKYVVILLALQKALRFTYKGITRIDVACDFNTFYNGRSVPKFIKEYVMSEPTDKNHIYRRGSDEFYIRGNKKKNQSSAFNYIRLGKKDSRVHCYIYDKSQELKEVKDKPWIKESWERAGLKNDDDNHVWRAEISIKNEGSQLLDMGTGELFKLAPDYLTTQNAVQKLFMFYARKYLDFRKKRKSDKLSKYDRVQLFDINICESCVPKYVPTSLQTGRTEKICANRLRQIIETYQDLTHDEYIAVTGTIHLLDMLSAVKKSKVEYTRNMHALDAFKTWDYMSVAQMTYLDIVDKLHQKKKGEHIADIFALSGAYMRNSDWWLYSDIDYNIAMDMTGDLP